MRLLLGRYGSELDDDVRLVEDLLEHRRCVVALGGVGFEQLAGREQNLVGSLASAASSAHAVGDDAEHAADDARMADQCHLVLLVVAVTLVDAGRCAKTKTFAHDGSHTPVCSNIC